MDGSSASEIASSDPSGSSNSPDASDPTTSVGNVSDVEYIEADTAVDLGFEYRDCSDEIVACSMSGMRTADSRVPEWCNAD